MKNKKILIIFIISLIVLCGAIGTYLFLHFDVSRLHEEMVVIRENISEGLAKEKELDSIKLDIKNTLGDYEKINRLFVSGGGLVDFIQYVESMGKDVGVSVITKSVTSKNGVENNSSGDSPEGFKEEIIISFDVFGSMKNSLTFLDLVEHLPYKINVTGVSFEKVDQKNIEKDLTSLKGFDYKSNISLSVIKSK